MRCGAGRPAWHVKAEHCKSLDVRRWQREGVLRDGYTGGWRWTDSYSGEETGSIGYRVSMNCGALAVTLNYRANEQSISDAVRIERTRCNFGGSRVWFQCPRCYRRAAKLFLRGARFACRHCQRLVYASQSEDAIGRTWRRQAKLEGHLGPNWTRPKGMHSKTRERLLDRIWDCEERRDDALACFLGQLMAKHPSLRNDPLFRGYSGAWVG